VVISLRDWQEIALDYIWSQDKGANSRNIWEHVNGKLGRGDPISRTSIIVFLNEMVEEEILSCREKQGKDDHRWDFTPKLN
jgi:predicted transcriptional regulator